MNLSSPLRRIAAWQPDRPAVMWEGATLSYAGFEDQVARLAGGLRTILGLAPGDRVAMAMDNAPEFLAVLFAIWRADMTAIPINAKLHPREFSWIFDNAKAAAVIATPKVATTLDTALPVISTASIDYARLLSSAPIETPAGGTTDPAWIFYTSGTTGRPKGAVLTHANLLAMSMAYFADVDHIGPDDIRLHAAPMSHGSGLYAIPFVLKGAANMVPSGGFDPAIVFETLAEHRNVSFFAAPTMVTRLLAAPEAGGPVTGLKTLEYGGAPMYVADCRRAVDAFGPRLYQLYGQGEAPMTISHVSKAMHVGADDGLLGSAGVARTGCEVAIVDGWDPVPLGSPGEIATRSDCVMAGYLDDDTATSQALRGGWLRTGDIGIIDERGVLTLLDRSKDMIISGGSNIYPREVEEVLLTAPGVAEVAIVGMPHSDWGEQVVACVVRQPGSDPTPDMLDAHCLGHLARFKRPKRYCFMDDLPKNNYGKVVKTLLRHRLDTG